MMRTILLTIFAVMLAAFGCVTNQQADLPVDAGSPDARNLLPRPQFGKPMLRPLGHVLLTWDRISEASGYELQESDSEDFQRILQNWIVSGMSIELPFSKGMTRWYRIRSFDLEKTSYWSPVLRLEGKDFR